MIVICKRLQALAMTHLALAEGLRVSPTAVLFERAHNDCAVDPIPTDTSQAVAAHLLDQGFFGVVAIAASGNDFPRGRLIAGRVAILPVDVEFVDEPSLLGHPREECRLIEFLAVPGQWTGRPVLHHTEQLEILHRRVRALEYRNRGLERKPRVSALLE